MEYEDLLSFKENFRLSNIAMFHLELLLDSNNVNLYDIDKIKYNPLNDKFEFYGSQENIMFVIQRTLLERL